MPTTTTNQQLTLPVGGDNANGPLAFSNYNSGVENRLVQRFLSIADRTARSTPSEGQISYLLDLNRYDYYDGTAWVTIARGIQLPTTIARRNAAQSIASGLGDTLVNFDNENFDNMGAFTATSTNITIPYSGVWEIDGYATFPTNATGVRVQAIGVNGVATGFEDNKSAITGVATTLFTNARLQLVLGDNVQMIVKQNSGGALNLTFAQLAVSLVTLT